MFHRPAARRRLAAAAVALGLLCTLSTSAWAGAREASPPRPLAQTTAVASRAGSATALSGYAIQSTAKVTDSAAAVSSPGYPASGWYPGRFALHGARGAAGGREVRRSVLLDRPAEDPQGRLPGSLVVPLGLHGRRHLRAYAPRLQRGDLGGRRLRQRPAGRHGDRRDRRLHPPRAGRHLTGAHGCQHGRLPHPAQRPEQEPHHGLDRLAAAAARREHGDRPRRARPPRRPGRPARRARGDRPRRAVALHRGPDGQGAGPQRLRARPSPPRSSGSIGATRSARPSHWPRTRPRPSPSLPPRSPGCTWPRRRCGGPRAWAGSPCTTSTSPPPSRGCVSDTAHETLRHPRRTAAASTPTAPGSTASTAAGC